MMSPDSDGNNNPDDHKIELIMDLLRQGHTKLISRRKYNCDHDCMLVLTSSNDKEDGNDENIFCMTKERNTFSCCERKLNIISFNL